MLILFVATQQEEEAPALPDLYIRDADSGVNTPVAGVEGWDADFLQTQTVCYAPMSFGEEESGIGVTDETGQYWCRRLSKILLRVNFSDAAANASIRPLYYDDDDIETMGDAVTVNAGSRQDGFAYMAPVEVFETYGANKVAFVLDSVSAGTINISVAGV
jgi:hypothetical protein